MVKTRPKGPGSPGSPAKGPGRESTGKLDETLTHLTEEVAKTASRYKVPIVVLIILVFAIILLSTLFSAYQRMREETWNDQIHALFQGDEDEAAQRDHDKQGRGIIERQDEGFTIDQTA